MVDLTKYSPENVPSEAAGVPSPIISPGVSLFCRAEDDHILYRLYVDQFLPDNPLVHAICDVLLGGTGADRIQIRINSPGGDVDQGIRLMNIVESRFRGRIETVVESNAYSMGAMLFSLGDRRVVHPHSNLMYHNYSAVMGGKGGELSSQVQHQAKMSEYYFNRVLNEGWLTEEEYGQMIDGKDHWFTADEMLQRGLATDISVDGVYCNRQEWLDNPDGAVVPVEDEEAAYAEA